MGGFQTIFSIRHCKLLGNLWFFILFLILQIFFFGLNLVWFKELSHRVWQRKSKKIAFLLSFFAIFKFFKLFTRGPSSYCFAVGRGGVANLNLISLLSQIFFAISFFLQYVEFQFFFSLVCNQEWLCTRRGQNWQFFPGIFFFCYECPVFVLFNRELQAMWILLSSLFSLFFLSFFHHLSRNPVNMY